MITATPDKQTIRDDQNDNNVLRLNKKMLHLDIKIILILLKHVT